MGGDYVQHALECPVQIISGARECLLVPFRILVIEPYINGDGVVVFFFRMLHRFDMLAARL